jgi:integrase
MSRVKPTRARACKEFDSAVLGGHRQHEASHNRTVWNGEARRSFAPTGGPHSFRHTFASLFLAGRADLFLLSETLGHSSERTTLIFAHMLPGAVASVAEVVSVGPATALRKGTDVEE